MKNLPTLVPSAALAAILAACGGAPDEPAPGPASSTPGTHVHADGTVHSDHDEAAGHGHGHDEVPIGAVTIGDMRVHLAQGHGAVEAGKESHLVVKLPHSDHGATIVRAWIGTEDRTLSFVGRGEYAAAHDDYDIHAVAPDPMPAGAMWWIEIEKPDGTRAVGSATPITQ